MEKQSTSAFNLIGIAIHRAIQVTEFAVKKVNREVDEGKMIASYEWVSRNKLESKPTKVDGKKSGNDTEIAASGLTWRNLPTHDDGKIDQKEVLGKSWSQTILEGKFPKETRKDDPQWWAKTASIGTWLQPLLLEPEPLEEQNEKEDPEVRDEDHVKEINAYKINYASVLTELQGRHEATAFNKWLTAITEANIVSTSNLAHVCSD